MAEICKGYQGKTIRKLSILRDENDFLSTQFRKQHKPATQVWDRAKYPRKLQFMPQISH